MFMQDYTEDKFSQNMEQFKGQISMALRKYYEKHPLFYNAFAASIEDGFPQDKPDLLVWLMGLLGNPNLKFGLEPGSLCSAGQKFFGNTDEVHFLEGLEQRDLAFLKAFQACIDDGSNPDLPFILTTTPLGKLCVKAKKEFLWSQELADQIATRRGLLPPNKVYRVKKITDSVYGPGFYFAPSFCGKHPLLTKHMNRDFCVKVINDASAQCFGAYMDTVEEAMYLTKNIDKKTGLPMRLVDENGSYIETKEEWEKRCENHKEFLRSRENLARAYSEGNKPLHTRWAVDACGRLYCVNGAEINPQGCDAQKAVVERYHKCDITHTMAESWIEKQCTGMTRFNPEQYLIIALANALHYDKKEWDIRIEAVSRLLVQYQGNLQKIFDDIKAYKTFKLFDDEEEWEASDPATAMACISAMDDCWNKGIPTGILLHYDATSSGYQFDAVELLDVNTAWQSCLVVLDDKPKRRENIYYHIKDGVAAEAEAAGNPLPMKINKYKVIKNGASIPYKYGSNRGPKKVFGKSHVGYFFTYMKKNHPASSYRHGQMVEVWDSSRTEYKWTMPDGYEVIVYSMADKDYSMTFCGHTIIAHNKNIIQPRETSRQLGANCTQSKDAFIMREVFRAAHPNLKKLHWISRHADLCGTQETCGNKELMRLLNLGEASGFYSLRIIDEIECKADLKVIPRDVLLELLGQFATEPYDVAPIHDCFMIAPHAVNHVRASYIYNMYKIARSEKWENYFMRQITGDPSYRSKLFYPDRKEFAEEILKTADYALC